jgi:tyrosinase
VDQISREFFISLVRVNGANAPKGTVIQVGELRIELTTEPAYIVLPVAPAGSGVPY